MLALEDELFVDGLEFYSSRRLVVFRGQKPTTDGSLESLLDPMPRLLTHPSSLATFGGTLPSREIDNYEREKSPRKVY